MAALGKNGDEGKRHNGGFYGTAIVYFLVVPGDAFCNVCVAYMHLECPSVYIFNFLNKKIIKQIYVVQRIILLLHGSK